MTGIFFDMQDHLLSILTFAPLIGLLVILLMSGRAVNGIRWFTLVLTLAIFLVSLSLVSRFSADASGFQLLERAEWFSTLRISYLLGVDGLSLWLVMLVTFLSPIVVLSSWRAIDDHVKEFHLMVLLLQMAMTGTLVSLDLMLFFVFWELMLIPMFLMIGIWGGKRRIYASVKFFIYTMAGSALMLVAIFYIGYKYSFDLTLILQEYTLSRQEQLWLFAAFTISFAIKVPMFPLHTWLPDAHVEAPTAGSVILAGVLLKMGTYGFVRFAVPLFPEAALAAAPLFKTLAVIGIIYGALVAMVQTDMKKLVAYSSVSHLGVVMLGIFTFSELGVKGGIYQMIGHGLSTGSLFLLVGIIYERRHKRMISDFGGIMHVMPLYGVCFMIATLSSVGLPGLNGFIGEIMVIISAVRDHVVWGVLAASGMILGAVYMLWMVQRVFFGEIKHEENRGLKDLSLREALVMLPLIIMMFVMGVVTTPFTSRMTVSVNEQIVDRIETVRVLQAMDSDSVVAHGDMIESTKDRHSEDIVNALAASRSSAARRFDPGTVAGPSTDGVPFAAERRQRGDGAP